MNDKMSWARSWAMAVIVASLCGCAAVRGPQDPARAQDAVGNQHRQQSQLDRIRKSGVLRVGVLSMTPWAMADDSGGWSGFDVDVATRLAANLGVRVEFARVSWASAADDTAEGRVDLTTGLWPGPRRGLVVNFSEPYATTDVSLVVDRAGASRLARLSDYDNPAVRIGVRSGGLSETVARERWPKATLVAFDSDEGQLDALARGAVTGLAARTPVPSLIVASDPTRYAMPFREPLARRSEVFAIPRGDADFLAYLNAWVRHHDETGWLGERRRFWLESLVWQVPP